MIIKKVYNGSNRPITLEFSNRQIENIRINPKKTVEVDIDLIQNDDLLKVKFDRLVKSRELRILSD